MRLSWKTLTSRLDRTADAELARSLADEAVRSGCTPVSAIRPRQQVHLRGTITMVTINPRGVNRWLEARMSDGTGEVNLVWMGRRMVRGVEAGRSVEVTGRVTLVEGRLAIYNPNYTLLPG